VADGATVLGRGHGDQACGETGDGRMLEPRSCWKTDRLFQPKVLAGQKVLVTAGPTFEAIDPVRGITNHSSGKMGFAIARAAREAGAEVTLVAGPVQPAHAARRARIDVQSRSKICSKPCCRWRKRSSYVFIATAAVADWRPATQPSRRSRRMAQGQTPALVLSKTPTSWPPWRSRPRTPGGPLYCVGFAAESHDLLAHATAKRLRKGVPLLVGNIGPATFGRTTTRCCWWTRRARELPHASKLRWLGAN
jgi:phosphopantothenoylcysteine decarboxylase/phosphopantothenate--cysteine ligase